jgi:hypothetical protein
MVYVRYKQPIIYAMNKGEIGQKRTDGVELSRSLVNEVNETISSSSRHSCN